MRRLLPLVFAAVLFGCNSPLVLVEESADSNGGGPAVKSSARATLTTTASSLTLDWAAQAQLGQFAIVDIITYGGAKPVITAPNGWQLIRDDHSPTTRQSLYSHVIQPGDAGTASWTFSQPVDTQGALVLLDNVARTNPIDASSATVGTGGRVAAPSVKTTAGGALVLSFCATDFSQAPLHPDIPAALSKVVVQDTMPREYWILATYRTNPGDTQARSFEFPQLFNWTGAQLAVKSQSAAADAH